MKIIFTITLIIFFSMISLAANAGHVIEVTEPSFTADKIELNPVTNSYIVVYPKYFVNAQVAVQIVSSGLSNSVSISKTAQHLCRFLGMSGGKVISTSSVAGHSCNYSTLTIQDSGLYSLTQYASSNNCGVIDFLECSQK